MKYRVYGLLTVGFGAFLAALPLLAHHEILAKFDDKKPMTLKGKMEAERPRRTVRSVV